MDLFRSYYEQESVPKHDPKPNLRADEMKMKYFFLWFSWCQAQPGNTYTQNLISTGGNQAAFPFIVWVRLFNVRHRHGSSS